jgi:hypothetical protein
VEETRIYARCEGSRQLIVYELQLVASGELAMVLPIPVLRGSGEDAVAFVDLTSSPAFFRALEFAFRPPVGELGMQPQSRLAKSQALVVHQVGAFEASFVPRARDFDRLDPRFAIPSSLWASVPTVKDFGFVVFRLREGDRGLVDRVLGRAVPRTFHPMAFWFPREDRARTFFPTLHVHDGRVHATASFDHVIYAQTAACPDGWESSRHGFRDGMGGDGRALVDDAIGHRRVLRGAMPNADTWIPS